MASQLSADNQLDLSKTLEVATRAAVLLGGLAYFTGLVVVNLHLAQYGVNLLGFFAHQYVTAGLLALFPAFTGGAVWLIGSKAWVLMSETCRSRGFSTIATGTLLSLTAFVMVAMGFGLATIPLGVMGMIPLGGISMEVGPASWYVCVGLGALMPASHRLNTLWYEEHREESRKRFWKLYGRTMSVLVIGALVGLYLPEFAVHVYGQIPSRWGGGGLARVTIIVATKNSPELQRAGATFAALDSSRVAMTVNLLLVTSDAVVACTKSGSTLLLRRELVDAMFLKGGPVPTQGPDSAKDDTRSYCSASK
jgi:hypothetical protein